MWLSEVSAPCPATECPVAAWMEEGRNILILTSAQGALQGEGATAVCWGRQRSSRGTPRPFTLPSSSRRPLVTRGNSRLRWRGPGWEEGNAVGKATAHLRQGRVCQVGFAGGRQRGAGTTGLLSPFPSQQDQTSALHREDLPEERCCSSPGDFPGVPAEGSPCLPRAVSLQQPHSLPGGDVCCRQSCSGANSLSTVTLNSGLSLF